VLGLTHLYIVAQICNLLYRRIGFCATSANASALELADALPIANLRYDTLCAKHIAGRGAVHLLVAVSPSEECRAS